MANFWQALPTPFMILAPMEDVTDFVFREIICEVGKPDVLFTEFTSVDGLTSKGRTETLRRFEFTEKQRPIVAQIWGNDPNKYYEVAQLIHELKFDGIDINMGCPVDMVIKRGCGAGLIKNQKLTDEIIAATKRSANGLPVSVKTRLGYDKIQTEEWISFLLQQKIDALTIHGRTVKELSKIPANWDEIGKAVNLRNTISPNTKIIGNGDVRDHNDTLSKHEQYHVDGIMIGRGIFTNPWVFDKTGKIHDQNESLTLLLKHTKLFEEKWGKIKNFDTMKKFFKIYVTGFDGASELRQKLMECKNYEEVEKEIKDTQTAT